MPVFELEMGGKMFEVEAPDMNAALGAIRGGPPAGVTPGAGIVPDLAKSAGIGAVKGAIGLADIPELGARGINWATKQVMSGLGMPEENRPDQPLASPKIQAAIEQHTGPFYQPQSPEGQMAERLGGFAPGMIGGPAGAGARLLTNVVAPFLATEGAGALTQGTGYETPAKLAAALLAPSAAGKALGAKTAPISTKTTVDEIEGAAAKTYDALKNRPVNPMDLWQTATKVEQELIQAGRRPRNAPQAFGAIDELKQIASESLTTGKPVVVADARSVRQNLSTLAADTIDKTERAVANKVTRGLDDMLDRVSPKLREANQNYAAAMRARDVAKAGENAEINAAAANSGLNVGNSIRQALKPDLKKPYGYKPAEIEQLARLVKGRGGINAARYTANALGGGGGLGQLAAAMAGGGGGFALGGPPGAMLGALAPVAGRALKGLENTLTKRELAKLEALIRAGAPAAQKAIKNPQVRALLARLLAASPTVPAQP